MANNNYKTSRKYRCPYCNFKDTRANLVDHVERDHHNMLPETYTGARVVYDFINGKYDEYLEIKQKLRRSLKWQVQLQQICLQSNQRRRS